jgi:hypothetical protein
MHASTARRQWLVVALSRYVSRSNSALRALSSSASPDDETESSAAGAGERPYRRQGGLTALATGADKGEYGSRSRYGLNGAFRVLF